MAPPDPARGRLTGALFLLARAPRCRPPWTELALPVTVNWFGGYETALQCSQRIFYFKKTLEPAMFPGPDAPLYQS